MKRFNRNLKTAMWKYCYVKGTYKWVDVLDESTKNYNNTKHSAVLMKPADEANRTKIRCGTHWLTIRLEIRISKYKSIFT